MFFFPIFLQFFCPQQKITVLFFVCVSDVGTVSRELSFFGMSSTGKEHHNKHMLRSTVEPRFNEPLCNKDLGITNDILQPGQSYSKMYGAEPRYNEPRYIEILIITNTIEKPKHKIYPDIMNKCHQTTKNECRTKQQR